MKKIVLILVAFLFSTTSIYAYQCDQSFYWKLRYWYQYKFYDNFSNNSSNSIWINKVDVNYTEEYDYNWSSSFPSFNWTSWFKNKWYILNHWESGKVIDANSSYPINYIPSVRSKNNFVIQYKAKYYEKKWWTWDMSHPKYHTECKYYQITWCWDWVLDSSDGEQCDPNDSNKQWWWVWWCDLSCKPINTPKTPTCDSLWVNPTTGSSPLTSAFYCVWTNASNYKIDISKGWSLIKTINWNSANYTFVNTGSYVATCYVNWNITSSSCTKNINITDSTPSPVCWNGIVESWEQCDDWNIVNWDWCSSTCQNETTPVCWNGIVESWEQCDDWNIVSWDWCSSTCQNEWWWWGGGTPMCYDISVSWNTVTCYWNNKTKTFKIDCGNWINKYVWAISNWTSQRIWTASCDYSINPKTIEPRCYVSWLPLNWIPNPKDSYSGWTTRNQCENTNWQTCWNWILEWNEECEKDSSWVFPNICNTNCTLKNPVTTTPWTTPWVITIPNHWSLIFWEQANVIIYRWQSLASKLNNPYIYNDSDYDLSLKWLCVVQTSWDTLTTPTIQPNCEALPAILYPGQKITFPWAYNDYKWKRVMSWDYGDNVLKITYQNHAWEIFDWAYFATPVKVRVAKPSIITVWWGTSYVKSVDKVSDINKVALTNKNNNKNFVWTSISKLTSYSKNTTDSKVVNNTKKQGIKYSNSLTWVINDSSATTSDIVWINNGESYNWMKNVFIFKNKNLKIDTSNALNSFNWPVTFIVENWNLYINKNIIYDNNIAFVVKGWDIIIDSWVTRIDGTYITIKKWTNWWKILSAQSTDTLVINGSLYWNIDDLVDNRVKITENAWNLSVWTIVSFGSALFRKPAPLVSQFITEYLNQSKIAK